METCRQCQHHFEITDSDRAFYGKMDVSEPTLCPDCREQRRLIQGNQMFLYKRTCDLTGKEVVTNFHPESPYKVYDEHVWYSDKWDPLESGRDFDFSRPFFEQFQELSLAVPRPSLHRGFQFDENSDYTNYAGKNKDCYLIFDSDENRECYYSYSVNGSQSSMDCFRLRTGELLYECIDCVQCYNSAFLQDCTNCSDSYFLKNCIGCKHCIMCNNLTNKEYYIENKASTKEEYERFVTLLKSRSRLESALQHFEKLKLQFPQKYIHGVQNENVRGDYLTNSKNADMCFDSPNLWDCKYVYQAFNPLKDTMDAHECGDGERLYECAFTGYNVFNLKFVTHALGECSDLTYCMFSPHSTNLFGCIGLRHKKYCILNKQYSKEDYIRMVDRMVEHMKKTKEWGEFFPATMSCFAYNETLAQERFPLTRDAVLAKGWTWRDQDKKQYQPSSYKIPDSIAETDASICDQLLACQKCGRNYKVIAPELNLLKRMGVPVSPLCFHCRHERRRLLRNPWKLWPRKCATCQTEIETTYSPEQKEIVYCEACYLKEVY